MRKIILIIAILIVLIVVVAASYVKLGLPSVGDAQDLHVEITAQRVQHGEYLANHVAVCMDCHSTRDWNKFSGPLEEGTLGKGGEYFGQEMGLPGKIYSKNITPFNLKGWTDGEIFRAITTGVDKDGKALFPLMPYLRYGKMDKEDVYDIIAYIRTLAPIDNKTPDHVLDFPMNFIVNTIPVKSSFTTRPSRSDTVNYGRYLVSQANCIECHTQVKKGEIIPELAYGGGRLFNMPNGELYTANITPDDETGIGKWTVDAFVAKFTSFKDSSAIYQLPPGQVNTIMPWAMFAGMDTSDIRSIYAYLRTVKPVKNNVVHFKANPGKK